jgi:staphylococcal nuclease domain-containing protein 1
MAQREPKKPQVTGRGVVKGVTSGDAVVLVAADKPGSAELELTLGGITAPRLARRGGKDADSSADEPWAWASREYLRKKVIGKPVNFVINHSMASKSGKQLSFGTITLPGQSETVNAQIVADGWAKAKVPSGDKLNAEQQRLKELADAAEQAKRGVWAPATAPEAAPKLQGQYDSSKILAQFKGKTLQGVVEYVRDGCTFRITALPSFHDMLVRIGGVQTPTFRMNDQRELVGEPGAKETKAFVETQVLHRDVTFTIEGLVDKSGLFYGNFALTGSAQPLAEILLKGGFASYVEWNAPVKDQERYRALQAEAQAAKVRMWHNYVPGASPAVGSTAAAPSSSPAPLLPPGAAQAAGSSGGPPRAGAVPPAEFTAKVRQVQSGGQMIVVDQATNVSYTIYLSSITVPRAGVPNQEDEPWGHEAREFLRSRLVGKKVRVNVDYSRKPGDAPGAPKRGPNDQGPPERFFCTVAHDRVNIATRLVEESFAKVINHRGGEKRSSHWEALSVAEATAQKKHKAIWSKGEAPKHLITVVSKAAKFMPFLERGRQRGVIDWVVSGSKFKIEVPTHSCQIALVLLGVQAPPRESPYSEAAIAYAREKCLQRDCELDVESFDKNNNFRGTLWIKRKNFALALLSNGLASISSQAVRLANAAEYQEAQQKAQQGRLGMWEKWDPEQEAERLRQAKAAEEAAEAEGAEDEKAATPGGVRNAVQIEVTEFVDAGCFFAQTLGEEREQLDDLMRQLAELDISSLAAPPVQEGSSLLAQFSGDSGWYRARVLSKTATGAANVKFVDFGNAEEVKADQLKVQPPQFDAIPPLAKEMHLAYVKCPPMTSASGQEAARYLKGLVYGKPMAANVEYREGPRYYVTVGDPSSGLHVNAALLRAGLARLNLPRGGRGVDEALVSKLEQEQAAAKRDRLGMWSFAEQADVFEDDPADQDRPAPAWGRKK